MIECVLRCTEKILLTYLSKIVNIYKQSGINVITLLMDSELECLGDKIKEVNLSMVTTKEQMQDIDQHILIIKYKTRSTHIFLTFKKALGG